jgi:hypothetical protein
MTLSSSTPKDRAQIDAANAGPAVSAAKRIPALVINIKLPIFRTMCQFLFSHVIVNHDKR